MRAFFTELRGKTVMTRDGEILGTLEDFISNTRTGHVDSMLIAPAATVEVRLFKTDARGRIMLPLKSMQAVRDVIIVEGTEAG